MRRTWLLGQVTGYLEFERRRIEEVLALDDATLIELCSRRAGETLAADHAGFTASRAADARAAAAAAGLQLICVCEAAYPRGLRELRAPPAVLHVAGGMERFLEMAGADPVAVVGCREPTNYGNEVAGMLSGGIGASGLSVVSGMARGVDAAAHRGALAAGARTIAVLPGCAADAYPKQNRQLHGQILRTGAAVSELGPGTAVRKWSFIARNRVIAALSRMTIVAQAAEGSGALVTARFAQVLGRPVGAAPGHVRLAQSAGPHLLLRAGAVLIRDCQDVMDALYGAGVRRAEPAGRAALSPKQRALLDAIGAGADTLGSLTRAGDGGDDLLAALAELELAGCVHRGMGGRYVVSI